MMAERKMSRDREVKHADLDPQPSIGHRLSYCDVGANERRDSSITLRDPITTPAIPFDRPAQTLAYKKCQNMWDITQKRLGTRFKGNR